MRAAFFDMDGVLFDSMPDHARAWEEVMTAHGLRFKALDAFLQEGRTGESVIWESIRRDQGREPDVEEVSTIYREKTERFYQLNQTRIIPDVDCVLREMQSMGVLLFVVTGSGQKSLLARLDHFFPGVFAPDRVISAHDYKQGKPHPEPYLKAFEKAHRLLPDLEKKDCIVVENAPLGVRAGVAAGLPVWVVNTGPLPDACLMSEGAEGVFKTMLELKAALESHA